MIYLQTHIPDVVEIAKTIDERGLLVVIASFFLVLLSGYFIIRTRSDTKIINKLTDSYEKTLVEITKMLSEVMVLQRSNTILIESMNEGMRETTLQQVKDFGKAMLENNKYKIGYDVYKIRKDNNIQDKEFVRIKLTSIITNAYNERNMRVDIITYKGKKLSSYINPAWLSKVIEIAFEAVYDDAMDYIRLTDRLDIIYKEVINDYFKNLIV